MEYKYIKADAFTYEASQGNPAACLFAESTPLTPGQMQAIAKEHKGFVMEVVFCETSATADCKLTYYTC